MDSALKTVISGSYRKHFNFILQIKSFLEAEGIIVQSPVSPEVTNPGDEFALLDADPLDDPRTLQDSVFAKIRGSAFLVVANINGYLGTAAVLEMGYAVSQGIQILTVEEVSDPNIAGYCRRFEEVFPRWGARFPSVSTAISSSK